MKKITIKSNKNRWENNEEKAKIMVQKLIAELDKMDCYSNTTELILSGLRDKKIEDAGLNKQPDISDIIDSLQYTYGLKVVKCNSLAEEIKMEAFVEQLNNNPYSLNSIQLCFA